MDRNIPAGGKSPERITDHDHYFGPPPTTEDGQVVLYRTQGDCWRVARDESEVEWAVRLGPVARRVKQVEVMLVTPEKAHA